MMSKWTFIFSLSVWLVSIKVCWTEVDANVDNVKSASLIAQGSGNGLCMSPHANTAPNVNQVPTLFDIVNRRYLYNSTVFTDAGNANTTSNSSKTCRCELISLTGVPTVQLVNASTLAATLSPTTSVPTSAETGVGGDRWRQKPSTAAALQSEPAPCQLVMFYTASCPFSARAAVGFNALARVFPDVRLVALDVLESSSLNTRFGIISVPMFVLIHGGRPQARFNDSEPTLPAFASFIEQHTNLTVPVSTPLEVTDEDLVGPLPTRPRQELDRCLVLAWLFVLGSLGYWSISRRVWRPLIDAAAAWWHEAELHLHQD